jgi:hypothetical protein
VAVHDRKPRDLHMPGSLSKRQEAHGLHVVDTVDPVAGVSGGVRCAGPDEWIGGVGLPGLFDAKVEVVDEVAWLRPAGGGVAETELALGIQGAFDFVVLVAIANDAATRAGNIHPRERHLSGVRPRPHRCHEVEIENFAFADEARTNLGRR